MPSTRTCKQCGRTFTTEHPSDKHMFCSRSCWRDFVATSKSPRNTQVTITCATCGKPFAIKKSKINTKFYCCRQCKAIGMRRRRQEEIERQFGKPIFSLLYDFYCIQGLGIKQIAKRIGVSDNNLWDWFEDLGIERRNKSDAVTLQWIGNDERKAAQKETIRKAIERGTFDRYRLSRIAKTDWARKRNSESKQGSKNWMFKRGGPANPHWKGGKIYYYGPSWNSQRNAARERDNYTCQYCGTTEDELGKQLDVHHIHKFRSFGLARHEEANNLNNLICLCPNCHIIAEVQSERRG